MPPRFYFAVGARPRWRDLTLCALVGQHDLLVPAGSPAARHLRHHPAFRVALDSWAWPPHNPQRPSLAAYWREVQTWRTTDGSWRCDWFAAYDTIGNPGKSQRDYSALLALLEADGCADAPLVPVTHYPGPAVDAILLDFHLGWAGTRGDLVANDGTLNRPGYAIGGLVPAHYNDQADAWYTDLLAALEEAVNTEANSEAQVSRELLHLHLFGVGKPSWVLRSPLVQSFDSSGPAMLASYGWTKIAPSYTEAYGLSPDKLIRSREARFVYWLIRYKANIGQPWTPVDPDALLDDGERWSFDGPARQLALFSSGEESPTHLTQAYAEIGA